MCFHPALIASGNKALLENKRWRIYLDLELLLTYPSPVTFVGIDYLLVLFLFARREVWLNDMGQSLLVWQCELLIWRGVILWRQMLLSLLLDVSLPAEAR